MGKRTCADSARNANLAKALLKKKKINDENKENVSTNMVNDLVPILTLDMSDTLNMSFHVPNMPATSIEAFCNLREVLADQSEQADLETEEEEDTGTLEDSVQDNELREGHIRV